MAVRPVPTLRHRLEFLFAKAVQSALAAFPLATVQTLGEALGLLFYAVDRRHRLVTRENLRRSDLGLTESEIRATARACFRHFGGMFIGSVWLASADPEALRAWVKVEGLEHFDAAQAEGRGFIQLTGHYGDWEATALAQSLAGRSLAVIGRSLDNPLLDAWMLGFRERFGNTVIPKDGGMRGALKALRRGRGVGYLLDQDALGMGVFVPFLGRWVSTFPSAATLAIRMDLPILPVFSRPTADGRMVVRFAPPFHAPRTGDEARDVWEATRLMVARIEAEVRRDPRLWFWMHNRFKTQPGIGDAPALPPEAWWPRRGDAPGAP